MLVYCLSNEKVWGKLWPYFDLQDLTNLMQTSVWVQTQASKDPRVFSQCVQTQVTAPSETTPETPKSPFSASEENEEIRSLLAK